jgi:hypothetical protein
MAFRILGQLQTGGAWAKEEVGAHGASKAWVISTLVLCNTDSGNADHFIVYVKTGGGAPGTPNVIYRGDVPPYESFVITNGITLADGEHIYVATEHGYIVATAFGDES